MRSLHLKEYLPTQYSYGPKTKTEFVSTKDPPGEPVALLGYLQSVDEDVAGRSMGAPTAATNIWNICL